MINYYKYLPTSSADEQWGMHVLNAGCNRIDKQVGYPAPGHPTHHYFNWAAGRMLDEYQLIYIAKGQGVFESLSAGQQDVKEGTVIILFPGEWHRFKPEVQTGWDEFWVGFGGEAIAHLVAQGFFSKASPVLYTGLHDSIIGLYDNIIHYTREEKTGYQPLVSGIVMHLLGLVYSLTKQQYFNGGDNATALLMNKAVIILRTEMENDIPMEQVARELNVSYAWFRKTFKSYTGLPPHQYMLQLRIEKAKMLLANHSLSIKEVSQTLNFESAAYFSKLFKKKNGVSPELFRVQQVNG